MAKVKAKFKRTTLPKNFFSAFNKDVQVLANQTSRKFAQDAVASVKKAIRNQEFNWKPLSPAYKKFKERKALDERIYVATKEYLNKGIGWWESQGKVFAGPKNGIHKPSGLTYRQLSRIHEFGTWTIPARPLWRPVLSKLLAKRKMYRKEYQKGVERAFRERYRRSVKIEKK